MNEFALIEKYFNWHDLPSNMQGVGDDCALIAIENHQQLATSIDTLIEGVHFPKNTSAHDIAFKALAVNLSDLAAMGATPWYFTLALTLPRIDENWLKQFSASLKTLAYQYKIDLVGGDTTKGQLSISLSVTGVLPKGEGLRRSGAQVDDSIFVSNTLGDAALAWQHIQNHTTPSAALLKKFNTPEPQIALGQKLLGVANSCIDVSDGLEQDLSHILNQSGVGANINLADIPLGKEVSNYVKATQDWCLPWSGGDDYELCFTLSTENMSQIKIIEKELNLTLTQIGVITKNQGLKVRGLDKTCQSYRHF